MDAMFLTTMPLAELVVRGTVTYLALVLALRLVGRREVGALGTTDLLVVVLIADAAGLGLGGSADSLGDSFVLVVTVLFWSVVLDGAAYRWSWVEALVKGPEKPLIRNGQLNRQVMHREFMTREEVLSQLRLHGVTDPSQVRHAYIEPNGMISVIREDGAEPDVPPRPPTG